MVFSWLGELVPMFWVMELDLASVSAMQCPVVGFGVSVGSVCLWAVLLALAVLDASISTAASKWLSQPPAPYLSLESLSVLLFPGSILHCRPKLAR